MKYAPAFQLHLGFLDVVLTPPAPPYSSLVLPGIVKILEPKAFQHTSDVRQQKQLVFEILK